MAENNCSEGPLSPWRRRPANRGRLSLLDASPDSDEPMALRSPAPPAGGGAVKRPLPSPSPRGRRPAPALPGLTTPVARRGLLATPAARAPSPPLPPPPSGAAAETLLLYPPGCLRHATWAHQETPRRLAALCGPAGVLRQAEFAGLQWLEECRPAAVADVLRVHDAAYLAHLREACARAPEGLGAGAGPGAPTPAERAAERRKRPSAGGAAAAATAASLDADTLLTQGSLEAALLAAGAACAAVDRVAAGRARNAFVASRPPGHHAGPRGCVPSDNFDRRPEMCSSGFCLLNNVAIAAAYARCVYGRPGSAAHAAGVPLLARVAIVDLDVHHGNGTEDIVRNLRPSQRRLPLPSSWAPVTYESYKPWLDDDDVRNVFFASVHLLDGDEFYPCSGAADDEPSEEQATIVNVPIEPVGPMEPPARAKLTPAQRAAFQEQASARFRAAVAERLLPRLAAFAPDLVLVSAGFDGHTDDFYSFLGEADYAWVTTELQRVADATAGGRLVSVLEGGYSVDPVHYIGRPTTRRRGPAQDAPPQKKTHGALARCVAAHVGALMGQEYPGGVERLLS